MRIKKRQDVYDFKEERRRDGREERRKGRGREKK